MTYPLWLLNTRNLHVVYRKICKYNNITPNHLGRTQGRCHRQPTDIATPKLRPNAPFVALLGNTKEAPCRSKANTQIFEASGPSRTTAGPANKSTCSQAAVFSVSMANNYKRSAYNQRSTRLSNRLSHHTLATTHSNYAGRRQTHNLDATRNHKTYKQGGYIPRTIQSRGLLQPPIPGPKKRRICSPCNRLKSAQQIHNERTLPNGKPNVHKAPAMPKRLHGQIRPERRLPNGGDPPTVATVSSIYLAGANLPVSMPAFRAKHGPRHIYKTTETRGDIPAHAQHETYHLSRRHANHRVVSGHPTSSHSNCTGTFTEPGIYNKLREVKSHALSSTRVPRLRDKLENTEILPTFREGYQRSKSLPIAPEGEPNVTPSPIPTSRFPGILSPGSLDCATPFQTHTELPHTPSSVEQWELSGHSPPRSPSTGGTPMVDRQHKTGEWECNTPPSDRDDDNLGRLKNGMGCHIRKTVDQWALVTSGKSPPHQCLGTESHFLGRTDIPEAPLERIGQTSPRQHNSGVL